MENTSTTASDDDKAWDAVMNDPLNKETMAEIAREIKEKAKLGQLEPFDVIKGADESVSLGSGQSVLQP